MIEADTPNLWEIRHCTDHSTVAAIVVIALTHAARLVNVDANLNETQIAELVNDLIEDFGFLKVEELKHVLKTAIRTKKIFGRLDYNVVMEWFETYSIERTAEAISLSDCDAAREYPPQPTAMSWETYINHLWDLAAYADPEAIEKLCQLQDRSPTRLKLLSKEERHKKECDFKQFYFNYLKNKR